MSISENGVVDGGGVALISHIVGFGVGAVVAAMVRPSFNSRISENSDGSLAIQARQKESVQDEQAILDEILAMRPFSEVVETLGNCTIPCPECGSALDLHTTVAQRLVKCTNSSCTKMTYVDGELLASQL